MFTNIQKQLDTLNSSQEKYKLYAWITTREFLGLRMRNFQCIIFIWIKTYREIVKAVCISVLLKKNSAQVNFLKFLKTRFYRTPSAYCFWKFYVAKRNRIFINLELITTKTLWIDSTCLKKLLKKILWMKQPNLLSGKTFVVNSSVT